MRCISLLSRAERVVNHFFSITKRLISSSVSPSYLTIKAVSKSYFKVFSVFFVSEISSFNVRYCVRMAISSASDFLSSVLIRFLTLPSESFPSAKLSSSNMPSECSSSISFNWFSLSLNNSSEAVIRCFSFAKYSSITIETGNKSHTTSSGAEAFFSFGFASLFLAAGCGVYSSAFHPLAAIR